MCPDKSILSAWFDGEVDLKWSGEVSRHLEECGECSAYINELKEMRSLLQSLPTPDFNDSLLRVKSRIREKKNLSGTVRLWQRKIPLPAAAAAAVIAASITFGTGFLTNNRNNRILMTRLENDYYSGQTVNMPGDKIDEIFRMMESSLNDEFSSNSIVELPADVNLIFNGDSQLIRSAGYKGSTSP